MDGMIVHSTINKCQTPANEFTYRYGLEDSLL